MHFRRSNFWAFNDVKLVRVYDVNSGYEVRKG